MWCDTPLFNNGYKPNIALLELFAIVIAVDLWALELLGKAITLRSDNMGTVAFINNMKADIPACMHLLRHVTLVCHKLQILLRAQHWNLESDLILRGMNQKFLQLHSEGATELLAPPKSLWPPNWTVKEMSWYNHDDL